MLEEELLETDLDKIKVNEISKLIWKEILTIQTKIFELSFYQYRLLITKLIKKGYVRMVDIANATGYSRERIYQIIDEFERKESERKNRNQNI